MDSFDQISGDPIGWFESIAENAVAVQTQTLRRILEQNCETEYLRKWLGEEFRVDDLDDSELECLYRNSVPLATHADFEPYIQRIADGDTNPILTQQPITSLSITSGTTEGRQKYVPYNMEYLEIYHIARLVESAFRSRIYPTLEEGKTMNFMYSSSNLLETNGGLAVGPVTTLIMNTAVLRGNKFLAFCSPLEMVYMGNKHKQLNYCHLLLGLFYSEKVEIILTNFAHSIVQLFASFEELWKDLCYDLREGTLSSRIDCPEMRKIVLDIITASPKPILASMIEEKCRGLEKTGWFGLIPELWPNAKYVRCIATGSMKLYVKKLRHYLRDLPLVGASYLASESFIGINATPNVDPEDIGFSVLPYASYFEFIPLQKEEKLVSSFSVGDNYKEDEPIPLSQTKVGQEYEIVLTTFTGLYRYRLGDIVKVVGFHKNTPKLKFICRSKVGLCVNGDKTTEKALEIVVERASELLNNKSKVELVDYTSHADLENQPGNYIIYWEIKGDVENDNTVLQECCTEMDKMFVDIGYVISRRKHCIGPLELCIVEKGTFKRIFECYVENGGNIGQFKTPRCTNNQAILGVLKANTIMSFHSTAYSN